LLVKKYPNGKASTHLHSLVPGDKLLIVAPIKGYQWKANSYSHITLIAGGAGITPIYQLAKGILNNPSDKTAMTLIFGINSDDDVLLRDEFAGMEKDYPGRFKAVYSVSNPGPDSPFRKGKVTKALLEGVLPKLPDGEDTKIFLCGPPAMEAALAGSRGSEGILQQLGYRKSQIHRF
jgi:cytochrome-b5 reductase